MQRSSHISIKLALYLAFGVMATLTTCATFVLFNEAMTSNLIAQRAARGAQLDKTFFLLASDFRSLRGVTQTTVIGVDDARTRLKQTESRLREIHAAALNSLLSQSFVASDYIDQLNKSFDLVVLRFDDLYEEAEKDLIVRKIESTNQWYSTTSAYSDILLEISERISDEIRITDPFILDLVQARRSIWAIRDKYGSQCRILRPNINTQRAIRPEQARELSEISGMLSASWKAIEDVTRILPAESSFVSSVRQARAATTAQQAIIESFVLKLGTPDAPVISPAEWTATCQSPFADIVGAASSALDEAIRQSSNKAELKFKRLVLVGSLTMASLLALAGGIYTVRTRVSSPIDQILQTIERLSRNDLDTPVPSFRSDEFGMVASALDELRRSSTLKAELERTENIISAVETTVRSVVDTTRSVSSTSSEISKGSADLASRTESQAISLREVVDAMGAISQIGGNNVEASSKAEKISIEAEKLTGLGAEAYASIVEAMSGIKTASDRISEIIHVIDEISFQTKLLSLNAAVEAARAGSAGKGFAVVAQEVRALADRSRDASRQIRALITTGVKEVDRGNDLVQHSRALLSSVGEIVGEIRSISPTVAKGSRDQLGRVERINEQLLNLDRSTQQNAALVEESSAAAAMLANQAASLLSTIELLQEVAARQSVERIGA